MSTKALRTASLAVLKGATNAIDVCSRLEQCDEFKKNEVLESARIDSVDCGNGPMTNQSTSLVKTGKY